MARTCCAYDCGGTYVKGSGVSFHLFPKDPERRKVWARNLGRKNFVPSDHSSICSKHFEEKCFDREEFGARWLKPTAVPTLFTFPSHLQPKETRRKYPRKKKLPAARSISKNINFRKVSNITDEASSSSEIIAPSKRKRLSRLSDFKGSNVRSQVKADKEWKIAEKLIEKEKKKNLELLRKQTQLEKKVADLSAMLKEMKQRNCIQNDVKDSLQHKIKTQVRSINKKEKIGSNKKKKVFEFVGIKVKKELDSEGQTEAELA